MLNVSSGRDSSGGCFPCIPHRLLTNSHISLLEKVADSRYDSCVSLSTTLPCTIALGNLGISTLCQDNFCQESMYLFHHLVTDMSVVESFRYPSQGKESKASVTQCTRTTGLPGQGMESSTKRSHRFLFSKDCILRRVSGLIFIRQRTVTEFFL